MITKRKRNLIIHFIGLSLLSILLAPTSNAKVVSGKACKKAGLQKVYKGKIYTCKKFGKRLYWNKGKGFSVKPTRDPSASVSPKPTTTPSANPTKSQSPITEVLPFVSETYYGQNGNAPFDSCWFAKQATNNSNQISIAARQVTDVVGPDGTVRGSVWWMIPSLLPGESIWLSNYFGSLTNPRGCNEKPSRVFDKALTRLSSSTGSPSAETSLITPEGDRPKVLEVIRVPVVGTEKFSFKLRVQNKSTEKEIIRNNLTVINFVFLSVDNKPIFALSGPIAGDIPPGGEAILQSATYDIPEVAIPVGTVSIVGSLNFVLCKKETYPKKDICSY